MTPKDKIAIITMILFSGFLIWVTSEGSKRKEVFVAYILGWFFPGLGHLIMAKYYKALFFLVSISLIYLTGLWLTNFRMVGFEDNPFYYIGQFGCGLMTILSGILSYEKAIPKEGLPLSFFDPALLYVCVAGLLNFIVALNVFVIKSTVIPWIKQR